MSFAVTILQGAANSLIDQADYYRQESGEALERKWYLAFDSAIRRLESTPLLGTRCYRFRPPHDQRRRVFVPGFKNFLLLYRTSETEESVIVVNVIHGARDIEAILDQTEESGPQ